MLVMPTRFCLIMLCFFLGCIVCHTASFGHDFSKGPITGFRKKIVFGSIRCLLSIIIFLTGMKVEKKNVNVDYKKYLGQDY